jgi:hypothetical protein
VEGKSGVKPHALQGASHIGIVDSKPEAFNQARPAE